MTHFTVMARFEDDGTEIEAQLTRLLAPFDENMEAPAHKSYLGEDSLKRMAEHYGFEPGDEAGILNNLEKWTGEPGGKDEQGYYSMSTYNPNSKWDWWTIGGRWSGSHIRLKNGKEGIKGRPGVFDNETGIDVCYLKDLDFDAIEQNQKERVITAWEEAQKEKNKGLKQIVYDVQKGETREQYLKRKTSGTFVTHAVVDKDGWHEAAKMGWFAVEHSRTEEEDVWTTKFRERFLSNPTDKTMIAIIDCHI